MSRDVTDGNDLTIARVGVSTVEAAAMCKYYAEDS